MSGPRVITFGEWLRMIAAALDVSASDLLLEIDIGAAQSALEAPSTNYRGLLLHDDLANQAAALTIAMLSRPPIERRRRELAFLTLVLFLAHNGVGLRVDAAQRETFVRGGRRNAASQPELAAWVQARLVTLPGQGPSPTTGSPASPAPVVFVAMPVCGVRDEPEERDRLQHLAGGLDRAIQRRQPAHKSATIKVEIAAIEYGTAAGPHLADTDDTDRQLSELLGPEPANGFRRRLEHALSICSFLVILGSDFGSFGVGNEFARVSRATPVLYLNPARAAVSRWLDDGASFAHLEVLSVNDTEHAVAQTLDWLDRWYVVGERRWRERQLRMLRLGGIAAVFAEAWGGLTTADARRDAYLRTGLPLDAFTALLSPDGVAAASVEELLAMADALGLDPVALARTAAGRSVGAGPSVPIDPLSKREYAAFLTAWHSSDWDDATAFGVLQLGRTRARQRLALADAGREARQSLNHHTAWIRLAEDL